MKGIINYPQKEHILTRLTFVRIGCRITIPKFGRICDEQKLMRIIRRGHGNPACSRMIVPAASAMPQESADGSIKRISVVINGDAKTRRGICWYTTEKCGSDVEVMPLAKYNGSFDGALKLPGTCTKWKENYCHKIARRKS